MCHAPRASSSRMSRLPAALILLVLILIRESRQQLETTTDQRIIYRGVVNITLADTRNQEAFMQQMHIAPESNLVCNIIHIPTRIAFLIFQIHVHEYNVTLSYDEANNDKGKSVFGSNIGLFFDARSNAPKTVYLRNQNVHSVDALLVITVYGDGAPIPGGCNMEFETEVAPYMKLKAENGLIMIDMQPASLSALTYPPKFTCGKSGIKHTVYQMFLPEYDFSTDSYFSAIQTMMTVENIVKNGRKMTPGCNTPMRRVHSAYVGVGSVYVAVSQYKNYSSAFVPTFSYACSPLLYPESCRMLYGIMPKIVCFFALCLGIGTVFGSRNRSYIPIFSIGCVIGYASAKGSMSLEISLLLAIVAGILAIGLEYCVSAMCKREPSDDHGENVLVFLIAGTLLASATYLHLPDALQFSNDFAFWLLFFSLIFFFILLIMGLNFMRLPLSTTIFGTSLIVLSIDYYTSSCLKYILINIIRRATVTDFDLATVDPPYQTADIWMTVLWCCLGVVGLWKLAPDNSDPFSRFTEIMSRFPRDPREPRTPREPRIPREPRTPREPRFPRNLIYTHYAPSAPNYHSFPQYSFD